MSREYRAIATALSVVAVVIIVCLVIVLLINAYAFDRKLGMFITGFIIIVLSALAGAVLTSEGRS